MFHILFDNEFNIVSCKIKPLDLSTPGHPEINDVLGFAPESVTFDNDKNIYISIDPWKEIYKPDIAQRKKLSQEELDNFYSFVPIIYKFKNEF